MNMAGDYPPDLNNTNRILFFLILVYRESIFMYHWYRYRAGRSVFKNITNIFEYFENFLKKIL